MREFWIEWDGKSFQAFIDEKPIQAVYSWKNIYRMVTREAFDSVVTERDEVYSKLSTVNQERDQALAEIQRQKDLHYERTKFAEGIISERDAALAEVERLRGERHFAKTTFINKEIDQLTKERDEVLDCLAELFIQTRKAYESSGFPIDILTDQQAQATLRKFGRIL